MRITTSMMANNAAERLQMNYEQLFVLQKRAGSGKLYSQSSDNPSATSRILQLRSTLQANQSFLDSANRIDLSMDTLEGALGDLVDVAKNVISQGKTATPDTIGADERKGILAEIKGLFMQAVNIANTTHEGKYIFNGYSVDDQPYDADEMSYQLTSTPSDAGQTIVQKYGKSQSIITNVNGETTVTPFLNAIRSVIDAMEAEPFNRDDLLSGINEVTSALETIKTDLTTVGARMREMDTNITYLKNINVEIKSLLSQNEDVDIAEAISELTQQQTVYQTSLNVAKSAINNQNLFNYL